MTLSGKASFAFAFLASTTALGQAPPASEPAPAAPTAAAPAPAVPAPLDAKPTLPDTQPAPPDATAKADSKAATQAEVAELKAEVEALKNQIDEVRVNAAEGDTFEKKLDIYGFADMGLQRVWSGSHSLTSGTGSPRALTFVLGNVNLYFDATPSSGWRALTEVRITNYPDGALVQPAVPALGIPQNQTSTTVFDVNSPDPGWNQVRWGSIVLEQAWLQGTASDLFSVRLGYFLTPFGIWSIDHGTPTLIALERPQFTRGRFFPDHQLGAQILGQAQKGSWTYGYVGYVSNGKTQGSLDVNDDKAFGARLTASTTRPARLALGLSGYTGRYSQVVNEAQPDLSVTTRETVGYRQWDIGADVSLDIDAFRLRSEGTIERIQYTPGHRDTVFNVPGTEWPDRTVWGYYLLGAYQLPWWGVEPYLSGEIYRYPSPLGEAAVIPGAGVNVHFTTEVQLKTQVARAHFFDFDGTSHSDQDVSVFAARLVMAF